MIKIPKGMVNTHFNKFKIVPFCWISKYNDYFSFWHKMLDIVQYYVSGFVQVLIAREIPPVRIKMKVRRTALS